MPGTRFTCELAPADRPGCTEYARVTIADAAGDRARACPRHAVGALDADAGRVDWADTRALNTYEAQALELSDEAAGRRQATAQMEALAEAAAGDALRAAGTVRQRDRDTPRPERAAELRAVPEPELAAEP